MLSKSLEESEKNKIYLLYIFCNKLLLIIVIDQKMLKEEKAGQDVLNVPGLRWKLSLLTKRNIILFLWKRKLILQLTFTSEHWYNIIFWEFYYKN